MGFDIHQAFSVQLLTLHSRAINRMRQRQQRHGDSRSSCCSGFQAHLWPLTCETAHNCEVGWLFDFPDYILHAGPGEV